ncbi:MAG TPA: DUF190 domain-containing protein [Cyclobacteriaceae bacterium]|jgi:PII-like signaling protein|nr:DUF190 domain-containing protein [Cyclobacteriaceae bacterium]
MSLGFPQTKMLEAQIFLGQQKRGDLVPVHEFVMDFLLRNGIIGATVVKAHGGFGASRRLKRIGGIFSHDESPMIIIFIDKEVKVRKVLKLLSHEITSMMIATIAVDKFEL